ncbi:MAG: hypothetical protein AAFR71_13050 [Pseudomonadota bacterium]
MREGHRFQKSSGDAAFALVTVLLFLLIVTAVITPLVLAARTEFTIDSRNHLSVRQEILARGLAQVIARRIALRVSEPLAPLTMDSTVFETQCGPYQIMVVAQDQAGLVDLNVSAEPLVAAGVEAMGLPVTQARNLAEAIVSFRTPSSGPGSAPGEALATFGMKHGPYEGIEEIYELDGISGIAFERLLMTVTIHNGLPIVDPTAYSAPLAAVLPSAPSNRFPYVSDKDLILQTASILVQVKDGRSSARALWGGYFDFTADTNRFTLKESIADPATIGLAPVPLAGFEDYEKVTCAGLFGAGVADQLEVAP